MNLGEIRVVMNPSAFEEMIELANRGFTLEITKTTDDYPMVLAKKGSHVRQFLFRYEREEF